MQECFDCELNVNAGESSLAAVLKHFNDVIIPACGKFKEYGFCRTEQKQNFLHGLRLFVQSIQSRFPSARIWEYF